MSVIHPLRNLLIGVLGSNAGHWINLGSDWTINLGDRGEGFAYLRHSYKDSESRVCFFVERCLQISIIKRLPNPRTLKVQHHFLQVLHGKTLREPCFSSWETLTNSLRSAPPLFCDAPSRRKRCPLLVSYITWQWKGKVFKPSFPACGHVNAHFGTEQVHCWSLACAATQAMRNPCFTNCN